MIRTKVAIHLLTQRLQQTLIFKLHNAALSYTEKSYIKFSFCLNPGAHFA